ncbi:sigma 54-interacting transcriptional regulator [Nitrospina watsonii]|uniref:Transmembrane signal transduction receptor and sigma-54 dependent response regulator n=1 Tax=Nitrospina watsonii TaxID=1323948 RepID=A0ABN8VY24_9BACT|nr:sigma 54-interacting transcriptional regulator [Nitrospina watsonii]CAI2716978.1 Putative transmembrane signal transduction receptor and sigma-54 dependent response regulator [Nitrospina watsonii]
MLRLRELVLGLIGAGLTGLLLWSLPNLVQSWEWKTLDLRFQWRGALATDPNLVLIEADDQSAVTFGRWPWKRTVHAHLVETLHDQKTKTVVYDVLFALKGNSLEDRALEEAVKIAGNVVFPVAVRLMEKRKPYAPDHSDTGLPWPGLERPLESRRYFHANRAIFPLASLAEHVQGLGHIATNRDADGIIRRVPLLVRYHKQLVPSLAFQGVLAYLNVSPENVVPGNRAILIRNARFPGSTVPRDIEIPVDEQGQMLINYAGRWGETFQHVSMSAVLERPQPGELATGPSVTLENKLALVANTISGYDAKPVPVEKDFPGVGVHANILNTLLTGNFLKETSTAFNLLLVLALSLATAQVLSVRYYALQVVLVAALLAAYAFTAAYLFHSHLVLPVVAPLAAIVVTTLWVSLYNASTEKEAAEKMTHTAQMLSGEKQKVEAHLENLSRDLTSQQQEMDALQQQYQQEKVQLENRIHDLRLHSGLGTSLNRLTQPLFQECREHGIVTLEDAVAETFRELKQVAPNASSVLLLGESGTGKELFARALHRLSGRPGRFVALNLAACPEGLVESELFGHVKGAFTGATSDKPGRFREAEGGTLFLDEIGEVHADIQVKLLRVLQEKEVQPVGGERTFTVDVRVVSATNKDLKAEMEVGRFRGDLYYRLNTIPFTLHPLRERPKDIELLAWHFMDRYKHRYGRNINGISKKAMDALKAHAWPGNVREFENVIERGVTLADGTVIQEKDLQLKSEMETAAAPKPPSGARAPDRDEVFLDTLRRNQFEINATANHLEVSRNTVASRFKGICFQRLVDSGNDPAQAARAIAGETPHYEFVSQKLDEYYQNLVKDSAAWEDVEAAAADALKRSRNVPTAYHPAIAQLVRDRFQQDHA